MATRHTTTNIRVSKIHPVLGFIGALGTYKTK